MARKVFLRGKWRTYSKLGKRRKKKQKYRKATGIHNKIRLEMKGNPARAKIGYKRFGKKQQRIIRNCEELEKTENGEKVILAKVGNKKKLEIAKKAQERGVIIINANLKKLMKKMEGKKSEKKPAEAPKNNKEKPEENKSEEKK